MLKFIKQNLETIDGISIYPIISLVLFFTVFITMVFLVFKMNKTKLNELEKLPLED